MGCTQPWLTAGAKGIQAFLSLFPSSAHGPGFATWNTSAGLSSAHHTTGCACFSLGTRHTCGTFERDMGKVALFSFSFIFPCEYFIFLHLLIYLLIVGRLVWSETSLKSHFSLLLPGRAQGSNSGCSSVSPSLPAELSCQSAQ